MNKTNTDLSINAFHSTSFSQYILIRFSSHTLTTINVNSKIWPKKIVALSFKWDKRKIPPPYCSLDRQCTKDERAKIFRVFGDCLSECFWNNLSFSWKNSQSNLASDYGNLISNHLIVKRSTALVKNVLKVQESPVFVEEDSQVNFVACFHDLQNKSTVGQ